MITFLNVLYSISVLVLTASGLVIIFGLMKVVNFAHGEAMMIGAYVALYSEKWHSFALSVIAAGVTAMIVGVIVEKIVVRKLYMRSLDTILATWGIGLFIREFVRINQSNSYNSIRPPITGPISVLGSEYSGYRMLIIFLAFLLLMSMWLIDHKTQMGKVVRAVIANPELARSIGINVDRVYFLSFGSGWLLAGIAGALMAPLVTITPYLGSGFLVGGFLTTILAGVQLIGIAPAAIGLGVTNGVVSTYFDTTTGVIALLMVAMLAMRIKDFRKSNTKGRR